MAEDTPTPTSTPVAAEIEPRQHHDDGLDQRRCANTGCRAPIRGNEFILQVSTAHLRWFCGTECVINGQANHYRCCQAASLPGVPPGRTTDAYWAEADRIFDGSVEPSGRKGTDDLFPVLRFEDGWLLCPQCTDLHTHIESATVRDSTKQSITVKASGEDSFGQLGVTMPGRALVNSGSDRRQDITLHMYCEFCGYSSEITFVQQKGSTKLQISGTPPSADGSPDVPGLPLGDGIPRPAQ